MTTTFGTVDGALSRQRVRRDLVRLLPLGAVLLGLALLTDAAAAVAVVVALGGLVGAVCAIAAVVALVAARSQGLVAAAAYGGAGLLFGAAIVVALG
jgi:uncharacterized membrane protein YqgA involved in biofilm formation